MKISKINLANIWTYTNFVWDDVIKFREKSENKIYELWKLNLFYGENGSWKSTLSRLFRVLNWEDYLEIDLKPWWSTSPINYNIYDENCDEISWKLVGKVKIFDKKYIKDQVWDFIFDTDESTEQNRSRGEHFLLVGDFLEREKSIQKKEKEVQWKEQVYSKNLEDIWKDEKLHTKKYWHNYVKIYTQIFEWKLQKESLEQNLQSKQEELLLQETIHWEKEKIILIPDQLGKVTKIDVINQSQWDSFQDTIDNAVSFVFWEKNQIERLIELTNIHNLEKCLLCNQDIKCDWNYIARIQTLISKIITPKIDIISSSLLYINGILKRINNISTDQSINLAKNKQTYDKYKVIILQNAKPYPDRNSILGESDYILLKNCEEYIINKQNKLSEKIEIWDLWKDINDIIIKINNAIDEHNNQIILIEKDINMLKCKQVSLWDITIKKTEIDIINKSLLIIQNQIEIDNFIKKINQIEKEKKNIDEDKEFINTEKQNIKSDFSAFTSKYGIVIKKLIELINPSLARKINFSLQWTYTQWKWRCGFEIKHAESNTIITKHLSDWEKRSIAFSYFLSQFFKLDENKSLILSIDCGKDYIVVFDDPSTDYDKNNKSIIAEKIVELSKWFEQTFVFTHDEKFRDYIIKQTDINPIKWDFKRYKITKNYIWKSSISILNKNQSDINHWMLLSSLTETNPDLSSIAHALRYCIENLVCDNLLGDSESSIDALVKNKLWWKWFDNIKKANDKNSEIRSLYTFCNNNWSHYWETDWFEPLAENIRSYFEIHDYIFSSNFTKSIPQK